jgi:hypothetical protein
MQPDSLAREIHGQPGRAIAAFEVGFRRGEPRQPVRVQASRFAQFPRSDHRNGIPARRALEFAPMTRAGATRLGERDNAGVLRPKSRPMHLHLAPSGDRPMGMTRVAEVRAEPLVAVVVHRI